MTKRQIATALVIGQIYFRSEESEQELKYAGEFLDALAFEKVTPTIFSSLPNAPARRIEGYQKDTIFWENVEVTEEAPSKTMVEEAEATYHDELSSAIALLFIEEVITAEQVIDLTAKAFSEQQEVGVFSVLSKIEQSAPERVMEIKRCAVKGILSIIHSTLKDFSKN